MEHYEGIIMPEKQNKKRTIAAAIVAGVVIFAGTAFLVFTVRGKALAKNVSAVAVSSFSDAFGFSHGDAGAEAIVLENASETLASDNFLVSRNETSTKSVSNGKKKTKVATTSKAAAVKNKISLNPADGASLNTVFSSPIIVADPASLASSSGTPSANSNVPSGAPPVYMPQQSHMQNYVVSISLMGDGRGMVTSSPPGLSCGSTCDWSFSDGQVIKLHTTVDTVSSFGGWSGACSGTSKDCTFTVGGDASVGATFRSAAGISVPASETSDGSGDIGISNDSGPGDVPAQASDQPSSTQSGIASPSDASSSPANGAVSVDHPVIVTVQIAGQSASNDFVELFNPTEYVVDMSGWKLHKKSSTGTDYSLKEFPKGTSIASGGSFLWANSDGGFSASVNADVSTSETLSSDNSVALLDASGTVIDALAWGNGANQYGEGSPYPTNPAANQILARIANGGAVVDTNNNATDFSLQ